MNGTRETLAELENTAATCLHDCRRSPDSRLGAIHTFRALQEKFPKDTPDHIGVSLRSTFSNVEPKNPFDIPDAQADDWTIANYLKFSFPHIRDHDCRESYEEWYGVLHLLYTRLRTHGLLCKTSQHPFATVTKDPHAMYYKKYTADEQEQVAQLIMGSTAQHCSEFSEPTPKLWRDSLMKCIEQSRLKLYVLYQRNADYTKGIWGVLKLGQIPAGVDDPHWPKTIQTTLDHGTASARDVSWRVPERRTLRLPSVVVEGIAIDQNMCSTCPIRASELLAKEFPKHVMEWRPDWAWTPPKPAPTQRPRKT